MNLCLTTRTASSRRQAAALWTAVAERSGDTACSRRAGAESTWPGRGIESGVALRFPPQSKMLAVVSNRAAHQRLAAFSLIEILVVVALLSVIILGLVAMFGQVQRAFRLGMTQVDVLEAGRATADLLARDLAGITPSYQNRNTSTVNFYAQLRPDPPLLQPLPGTAGPGRVNLLHEIFFLTRENQTWNGIGYFVRTNDNSGNLSFPGGSIGSLYRFATNYSEADFRQNGGDSVRDYNYALTHEWRGTPQNKTALATKIMDGVVHFKVTAFDTNGVEIVDNLRTDNANSDIRYPSAVAPGEIFLYNFYSNAVPASVEFELGVLEQRALERYNSIPAANAAARAKYLQDQAGKVHLFRMRVPVRNVDPVAYQ